jgi:hypothetical protein
MVIVLMIIILSETNAEKMERIQNEIEIAQMRNISYATKEVSEIDTKLEIKRAEIQSLENDKYIYEECKLLNTTEDLPINCRDITISLKDDLWWWVNKNWVSQEYKQLIWDTPKQRAEFLLRGYLSAWHIDDYMEFGMEYNIDPYLVMAIAKADSSLWNELKTAHNIGNVGNNDRWDTVAYANVRNWIRAMFRTLNNEYLWEIYTVWYLSCWGKFKLGLTDCFQNWEYVYATSDENWNINVINTLRLIYRDADISETYNFRT